MKKKEKSPDFLKDNSSKFFTFLKLHGNIKFLLTSKKDINQLPSAS